MKIDKQVVINKFEEKYNKKKLKFEINAKAYRDTLEKINSFMFDLNKKPSEMALLEKNLLILEKSFPSFNDNERNEYVCKEYELVMEYKFCINCQTDLSHNPQFKDRARRTNVMCENCGMTYFKPMVLTSSEETVQNLEEARNTLLNYVEIDENELNINWDPATIRWTVAPQDQVVLGTTTTNTTTTTPFMWPPDLQTNA